MQYRNDTPGPLTLAVEPPVVVEPGEVVDVDDHVAGLTPLDDGAPAEPTEPVFAPAAAVDDGPVDADDAGDAATTDPDGAPASAVDEQEPEATR